MRKFYKLLAICIILVFASTVYGAVYVPTRINGLKGDIVLSPSSSGSFLSGPVPGSPVLLEPFGMLVNDGYNIRHNTRNEPAYNKTWIGCPTTLNRSAQQRGSRNVDRGHQHDVQLDSQLHRLRRVCAQAHRGARSLVQACSTRLQQDGVHGRLLSPYAMLFLADGRQ